MAAPPAASAGAFQPPGRTPLAFTQVLSIHTSEASHNAVLAAQLPTSLAQLPFDKNSLAPISALTLQHGNSLPQLSVQVLHDHVLIEDGSAAAQVLANAIKGQSNNCFQFVVDGLCLRRCFALSHDYSSRLVCSRVGVVACVHVCSFV
jgi:hypothetical protein